MPEVKVTYIKQTSQRNVDNKGMNERESVSTSVVSNSLHSHGLKPARLLCPWDSPGQNTGVGRCSPLPLIPHLQGIFPTQGLNPGFLQCRQILYHQSHQEAPWILEWVAYPFSRGSSPPRNPMGVSCIAGWFFTNWATREAKVKLVCSIYQATTWPSFPANCPRNANVGVF